MIKENVQSPILSKISKSLSTMTLEQLQESFQSVNGSNVDKDIIININSIKNVDLIVKDFFNCDVEIFPNPIDGRTIVTYNGVSIGFVVREGTKNFFIARDGSRTLIKR